MWELLYALARVVSILLVIAGFGLVTWYAWPHPPDDLPED
jgi:hypothetical protein